MKLRTTSAALVASCALLVAGATTASAVDGGVPAPQASDTAKGVPLRVAADRADIKIGTAVNSDALVSDPTYRSITTREFNSVTAENVMKWESVEPQRGVNDFKQADALVKFAEQNGQSVRGHTLVWHNQLPSWLTDGVNDGSISNTELRQILKDHIFTVAGHFKGKLYQWDVVNEIFDESGNFNNDIWYQHLGPSYVADAFKWAHEADPHAKLFMNDYNVEGVNAKSTAYYNLAKQLRAQGIQVDGLGIQGHLDIQYGFPGDIPANLKRFGDLGMQTAFTEADVRMYLPATDESLAKQAQYFDGMLSACLGEASCKSFTVWGFADQYSWVPGTFAGEGAANLYDENYKTKPAFDAIQTDLAEGR